MGGEKDERMAKAGEWNGVDVSRKRRVLYRNLEPPLS